MTLTSRKLLKLTGWSFGGFLLVVLALAGLSPTSKPGRCSRHSRRECDA